MSDLDKVIAATEAVIDDLRLEASITEGSVETQILYGTINAFERFAGQLGALR